MLYAVLCTVFYNKLTYLVLTTDQTPSVQFVANLFVQYHILTTNQTRSLSLAVHVCANNRQLSVSVAKCSQYLPKLDALWPHLESGCMFNGIWWIASISQSIDISRYTCYLSHMIHWPVLCGGSTAQYLHQRLCYFIAVISAKKQFDNNLCNHRQTVSTLLNVLIDINENITQSLCGITPIHTHRTKIWTNFKTG